MTETSSEESEDSSKPEEYNGASSRYDDLDTQPLPFTPGPDDPPSVKPKRFQIFDPKDLPPEEVHIVSLMATAIKFAWQTINEKEHIPKPAPYVMRLSAWALLFDKAMHKAVATFLLSGALIFAMNLQSVILEPIATWVVGALFLSAIVSLWFVLRAYFDWHRTELCCEEGNTGLRGRAIRWLLLNPKKQLVETRRIMTIDVDQSTLAMTLGLDLWKVTMDSPADKDHHLHNLRFVKDAPRLEKTLERTREYLNQ